MLMVWKKGNSFKMTICLRVSIRQISGVQYLGRRWFLVKVAFGRVQRSCCVKIVFEAELVEKDSASTMQKNTSTPEETRSLGFFIGRGFVTTYHGSSRIGVSRYSPQKNGFTGGSACHAAWHKRLQRSQRYRTRILGDPWGWQERSHS